MGSAIPQGKLAEIVRAARSRTGVPAVAAGLSVDGETELAADGPVEVETPFRIASITKWFTASLAASLLELDDSQRAWLSHTAGFRPESQEPLPDACQGLWSYSNAGFWAVGEACARASRSSFSAAMRERILEPLGLEATTFEEPTGAAEGHLKAGETGHRPAGSLDYPESRRPSGGLWSTVGDVLRFGEQQLEHGERLRQPQVSALGEEYCLGCWRRELEGGRVAFDHEGSVGGFQSLLLVVPAERLMLAVLTNSWRGSGLIRRVVEGLGIRSSPIDGEWENGDYAIDGFSATVSGGTVTERETDRLTGEIIESRYRPSCGATLMSHRIDFPRPGVARIGWVALPRVDA